MKKLTTLRLVFVQLLAIAYLLHVPQSYLSPCVFSLAEVSLLPAENPVKCHYSETFLFMLIRLFAEKPKTGCLFQE